MKTIKKIIDCIIMISKEIPVFARDYRHDKKSRAGENGKRF